MFDYLAMAYKDSDYIVISILSVLQLPLVVELRMLFVFRVSAIAQVLVSTILLLTVQLAEKAHENSDCTIMVTIVH